jgi:DDE superfamily endonuclease
VAVTDRRRREDWARFVRDLVDGRYREADQLVLVMDQLNTHSPASLYEAFAPEEAKRLADRLEIHHTPKHGSWLNMAEIELSALGRDPGLRRGRLCPTGWVTGRRWSATSRPGSTAATLPLPGPIGNSPPRTPASSSVNSTQQWKADRALVLSQPCSAVFRADLLPRGLAVGGGGGEAVPGDVDGGGA